jgi:hypothetical protein
MLSSVQTVPNPMIAANSLFDAKTPNKGLSERFCADFNELIELPAWLKKMRKRKETG